MQEPQPGRPTRMEVLQLLRRKQAASAETIAAELNITPNAVRQHLANLEREGLVKRESLRHKRGRPSLLFSLTDRADAFFPKRYGQLATMVLTELQEMAGPEALDEVFRRIALRHAGPAAAELRTQDMPSRIRWLLNWINRAGTLAEAEDCEEGVRITIHNCPFRNTALKFPQVCTITPQLIVEVLGAQVSQSSSIHRKDPHCSFVIVRDQPADTGRSAAEPA
ncbi:MAG TPA: helix-turn-helix domain-containing protein [Candidatus Dormibacteraeota bacterium]|nr:helix-turn-helix domain-containing protein [Candidatus Dormibacteraeota bacterium]